MPNRLKGITYPTAGWTSIAAGYSHTCATRNNGTLWCWGANFYGPLGIGTTTTDVARPQVPIEQQRDHHLRVERLTKPGMRVRY